MGVRSKGSFTIGLALAAALLLTAPAGAKTVSYPATGHASFVVDVPDNWTLTAAKDEGDYLTITSPAGVVIQMRTLEAAWDDLQESMQDTKEYIAQHYDDVKMGEGQSLQHNGLDGYLAAGTAKEKDGRSVKIGTGFFKLKDGKLGEIWTVASTGDVEGLADAARVMNSYRTP